eukprot:1152869-Pelagomonas_calceolata.AAC.1
MRAQTGPDARIVTEHIICQMSRTPPLPPPQCTNAHTDSITHICPLANTAPRWNGRDDAGHIQPGVVGPRPPPHDPGRCPWHHHGEIKKEIVCVFVFVCARACVHAACLYVPVCEQVHL